MIKVYKIANKESVKIGIFKSYVDFANWLDKKRNKRKGVYYILPPNITSLAGMDTIEYDGAFCKSQKRGMI